MRKFGIIFLCTLIITVTKYTSAQDNEGTNCQTGLPIELNSSTVGQFLENDSDFFLIDIQSPSTMLTISTLGDPATDSRIFDADGLPVASELACCGATFINTTLETGSYCIEVIGLEQGLYRLELQTDLPTDDHGNSCETATNVGRTEIVGELSVYGDLDFFRIQVPESGGEVIVTTTGDPATNSRIFDEAGIPVATEAGCCGNTDLTATLNAGIYCVQISGGDGDVRGLYQFQIQGAIIPAGSCSGNNVSVSTPSLAFGTTPLGTLSVPKSIIITNTGMELLSIEPSVLSGIDATQFGILHDTCAHRTLQAGEQCSMQGIFAPLVAGVKAANIMIPCNDLDSLPLNVDLSGEGVPAP